MQSKLPWSVLTKLEEIRPEVEELTVENLNFQRLLKKHIHSQKAGDLQTKLFKKHDESSRPPILNELYPYSTNTKYYTGESLLLTNAKNRDLEEIASFVMMTSIAVMNAIDTLTSNLVKND